SQLSGESTVRELMLKTATSCREATAHLDFPLSTVAEMLGRFPDTTHEGLFNVALTFAKRQNGQALPILPFDSRNAEHLMACDLVFRATEVEPGLELVCDYDAELFEASTVQRLMGHLRSALSTIATAPDTHLERLNFLDSVELDQLLKEWN